MLGWYSLRRDHLWQSLASHRMPGVWPHGTQCVFSLVNRKTLRKAASYNVAPHTVAGDAGNAGDALIGAGNAGDAGGF